MNTQPENQPRRGDRGLRVIEGGGEGRALPNSPDGEVYLLSCCLLDGGETVGQCLKARLKPEAFYLHAHQMIYARLCELYQKTAPVGVEMLIEDLRQRRQLEAVGGVAYLMDVSAKIPTTAQATYFIEKLRDLWLLRSAIREGKGIVERAFAWQGNELADELSQAAAKFSRMADYAAGRHEGTMLEQAARATEIGKKLVAGKQDRSRWLNTGMPYVDLKLTPFDALNEDWFVVLAAPPSGGKSSLARQIALNNLVKGKRGVAFLLETGAVGWQLRLATTAARVDVRNLSREFPDRVAAFNRWQGEIERWHRPDCPAAAEGLPAGQRLWIFDDVFSIDAISAKMRALQRELTMGDPQKRGLDFAIVDYLQLVVPTNLRAQREQQVAEVSRRLKVLGKTLNLTIFVVSQFNRAGRAADRPPQMEDLRESGAIEQDADRIVAIWTPKEEEGGMKQDLNADTLDVQLHQLKHRNGPVGWVWAQFTRRTTRFEDSGHKHKGAPGTPKPADGYKRHDA